MPNDFVIFRILLSPLKDAGIPVSPESSLRDPSRTGYMDVAPGVIR